MSSDHQLACVYFSTTPLLRISLPPWSSAGKDTGQTKRLIQLPWTTLHGESQHTRRQPTRITPCVACE
eukprot:scaffold36344_cov66-Phaeocystis_antarctica.AAC.3